VSFTSGAFVVFLAIVLAAYWLVGRRAQNVLLVVASGVFYGFEHPWFLVPLAISASVDYASALAMARWPTRKRRWLAASLVTNLGMLAAFKYSGAVSGLYLPLGISFYTFQSLGYIIDVYRGTLAPQRDPIDFALFVMFFPQLVAGPIERAGRMFPQFARARRVTPDDVRSAITLIAWGFVKKLVVADSVAVIANKVFAVASPSFPILWAGVLAFGIQIYADFSGYSDIARGVARLFGFDIMRNFDHPYLSASPREFWRRWHISLSQWIRDYIFIPLGGSRRAPARVVVNLMLAFVVSGVWHGASWNFVAWGAYWGALVAASFVWRRMVGAQTETASRGVVRVVKTIAMFVAINIGWLLFRETQLAQLVDDLTTSPFAAPHVDWIAARYLAAYCALLSLPLWIDAVLDRTGVIARVAAAKWTPSTACMRVVLWAVMLAMVLAARSGSPQDFIYFHF
jgi:D-alanyl-lipoteichoic acid acyltransferase DltB (MBOAT superfamily)